VSRLEIRVAGAAVALSLLVVLSFGTPATPPAWFDTVRALAALPLIVWAVRATIQRTSSAIHAGTLFMAWALATTAVFGRVSFGLLFASALALALLALAESRSQLAGPFRSGLILLAVVTVGLTAWSMRDPDIGLDGNPRYFVGGKNALAMALLPLVFVLFSLWRPDQRTLRVMRWLLIGTACAVVLAGGSGTGTVMVLALGAGIATGGRLGKRWWPWFISIPIIHWALVSGWLLDTFGWADRFVQASLGKSSDFTRRAYIWDLSWIGIERQPLGQGRGYSFIGERFTDVSETHNLFLEALVTGGWPGALILLLLIGTVMRSSAHSGNAAAVYFVWVACLVGTMESYTFHLGFWLLLGLAAGAAHSSSREPSTSSREAVSR
jgi:O-antigen ligase